MADLSTALIQALSGVATKPDFAAADPYLPYAGIANQLQGAIPYADPDVSLRDKLLGAAITGLVGGGFSGLSDDYQTRAKKGFFDVALGTGDKEAARELLGTNLFQAAEEQGAMLDLFRVQDAAEKSAEMQALEFKARLQEKANKEKQIASLREMLLKKPEQAQQMAEMLDPEILAETGVTIPAREAEPIAMKADPATPGSNVDRYIALTNRFREEGQTPAQASESARLFMKGEIDIANEQKKEAEKLRQQAESMQTLADTAQRYVEDAGRTGGTFSGARDWASYLYSFISSDEQSQRDAETGLDSLKADIVAAARKPGAGAMSDPEMLTYIQSGPNTRNTPEANVEIIEKMRNVADLQSEKADFVDWYISKKGTADGAAQAWKAYKKENPLLIEKDGKLEWNRNRTDWRSFVGAAPSSATGTEIAPGGTDEAAEFQAFYQNVWLPMKGKK